MPKVDRIKRTPKQEAELQARVKKIRARIAATDKSLRLK
jgi:hypothetical protein